MSGCKMGPERSCNFLVSIYMLLSIKESGPHFSSLFLLPAYYNNWWISFAPLWVTWLKKMCNHMWHILSIAAHTETLTNTGNPGMFAIHFFCVWIILSLFIVVIQCHIQGTLMTVNHLCIHARRVKYHYHVLCCKQKSFY